MEKVELNKIKLDMILHSISYGKNGLIDRVEFDSWYKKCNFYSTDGRSWTLDYKDNCTAWWHFELFKGFGKSFQKDLEWLAETKNIHNVFCYILNKHLDHLFDKVSINYNNEKVSKLKQLITMYQACL